MAWLPGDTINAPVASNTPCRSGVVCPEISLFLTGRHAFQPALDSLIPEKNCADELGRSAEVAATSDRSCETSGRRCCSATWLWVPAVAGS